jgi:molybdate transport system substrate-binding protein
MAMAAAAALWIAGCGGKDKPSQELVVLCGSSFVGPTEQLCREFTEAAGIAMSTSVAGSEDFLPQVKTAGLGDVLITHDPYLDYVKDAGKYSDHVRVGFNVPVLAVQKGNPKGLTKIEDLTQEGLKVGLTDPQYSTAGEMVYALLEEKGIKDAVLKNVGNRLTKGHPTLGTWLKTGTVDAVIIWGGVAHTFADSLDVVKTPYEYKEEIGVHVIALNYTEQPESLKKFMDFVRTRGPEVFAEYGYVK